MSDEFKNDKVCRETMICKPHNVHGCEMCMVDDYYNWMDARKERRHAYKREWRETPTSERFDLGGEA